MIFCLYSEVLYTLSIFKVLQLNARARNLNANFSAISFDNNSVFRGSAKHMEWYQLKAKQSNRDNKMKMRGKNKYRNLFFIGSPFQWGPLCHDGGTPKWTHFAEHQLAEHQKEKLVRATLLSLIRQNGSSYLLCEGLDSELSMKLF